MLDIAKNPELKVFYKNRKLATIRVEEYLGPISKKEMAQLLGINRGTLYNRLAFNNWTYEELIQITNKLPVLT